jgi:Flp pilus assembly protein TadG
MNTYFVEKFQQEEMRTHMTDRKDIKLLKTGKNKNGQSMIEMTLLIPLMLILIVGALEFGRAFFTKIVVTNAAREAAYYLSLNPADYSGGSAPNTVLAAQSEASNSGISDISVTITPTSYVGEQSFSITVATELQDFWMLNLINDTFGITGEHHEFFSISSTVEMMVQ